MTAAQLRHRITHARVRTRGKPDAERKAGPAPVVTLAGGGPCFGVPPSAPASREESESQPARLRMPRTVEACHFWPPWAVGTEAAFKDSAIVRSESPRARWRLIW